jgi:hypothetical protein
VSAIRPRATLFAATWNELEHRPPVLREDFRNLSEQRPPLFRRQALRELSYFFRPRNPFHAITTLRADQKSAARPESDRHAAGAAQIKLTTSANGLSYRTTKKPTIAAPNQ